MFHILLGEGHGGLHTGQIIIMALLMSYALFPRWVLPVHEMLPIVLRRSVLCYASRSRDNAGGRAGRWSSNPAGASYLR